ncbi:hypothetical protein AWH48_11715 [Domibacillus aminovorans]|uniref:Uncharacterized protein n=1 Tax=Domibacillus aminovorans TaxID=29332 RepID=A0A177KKK1_9BACI|nr:hypothetical protein AWH48_11715 [Domibacillus aminovorans]
MMKKEGLRLFLFLFYRTNEKTNQGCEIVRHMVQGQVQAYPINNEKFPDSIETMVTDGYLRENETKCSAGGILPLMRKAKFW